MAEDFRKKFLGKIKSGADSGLILYALKSLERIIAMAIKPELYASLLFSTNTGEERYGALLQSTREGYVNISKKLLFLELDLAKLPEKRLRELASDPILRNYSHYLERQSQFKKHRLTEAEEKILADKEQTSKAAFARLFEQIISGKRFTLKKGDRTVELSEPEVLDLLYHPDRETRKVAAGRFTAGLKDEVQKLSFIYNTLGQDKKINDAYRRFERPEDSRHLDNETDRKSVEALVEAVRANYGIVRDYYAFKSKVLKFRTLYDYDRYAPVTASTIKIAFPEAKKIILEAFGTFDTEFREIAEQFFKKSWIHGTVTPGKRGGAYCSYLTPDLHPYVFVNYQNKVADVETLAHELGHAIHGYLMRNQTLLNFDSPLTLAETASVFAEMLVFDHLRKTLPTKEKLSLVMRTIEGLIASVFRQTAMFLFERDFHRERAGGELATDRINALWLNRQKEMFGDSVTLTSDYSYWWSYIPHFIETPFYVYAYAFGQLLTISLYARYLKENQSFPTKYKRFLSSGNTKSPRELLGELEVDINRPEFWNEGLQGIKALTEEAKNIWKELQ